MDEQTCTDLARNHRFHHLIAPAINNLPYLPTHTTAIPDVPPRVPRTHSTSPLPILYTPHDHLMRVPWVFLRHQKYTANDAPRPPPNLTRNLSREIRPRAPHAFNFVHTHSPLRLIHIQRGILELFTCSTRSIRRIAPDRTLKNISYVFFRNSFSSKRSHTSENAS